MRKIQLTENKIVTIAYVISKVLKQFVISLLHMVKCEWKKNSWKEELLSTVSRTCGLREHYQDRKAVSRGRFSVQKAFSGQNTKGVTE
jgi:hypothetical protein